MADDIVGLTKVDAGTNDVTEISMPFSPMGEGLPSDFISGNFMGDGSPLSDRLYVYSAVTGLMTNALYSAWGWLDPATLSNSCMTASRGDTLYFARTDGDPISFSLFGRVGSSALSYPRFSYFSVDPQDAFADMEIVTGGRPVDLLSTYSSTTNPPVSGWSHVARDVSAAEALSFRDELPLALSSKYYLAADASLDTDGDGIPDALESRVYGTSPFLADTDGDGIPDGVELAWGTNPLVAAPASAVLFSETFERPAVSPGPINGQNGWTTQSGRANAVATDPHGGVAALEISQGENDESTTVSHDFTASDSDVVWLDLWVVASSTDIALPSQEDVALIAFDYEMHPVLSDGPFVVTNTSVTAIDDTWTRCTAMVDYGNRTWDFYLDGVLVNSGLAIGAAAVRPTSLSFSGEGGKADDIFVGTERPLGLSSDGDALPDEWEFAAFGTLARDGSGDFDSDGISDAAEFAAGTDPAASDRPSGGNGLFAEFFRTTGGLSDIPDFDALMASSSAVVEAIDFPTTPWPAGSPAPGDKFACRVTGYVCISERGRYTFFVTADDGVRLSVDGQVVVSDPAPHSARTTLSTVELGVGWHEVEILYYENTGSEVLKLEWSGPGIAREVIPASRLCHQSLDVPPTGFASGLDASYYALAYSPSSMPNFGNLSPACRTTTPVIDFTSTSGAFAGAPQEMTERFGALYEGFIFVPKSGVYDLKLTSDDGSRLWLDGEIAVNHDGAHSMTTKSASVPLSRGLHAFRLEYFEISGVAGLQLSWALQGFASEIIPARYFVRLVADAVPDTDRDGMPDWWEEMHDLNLADSSDAALDLDGDRLTNLAEFLAGTDPHCADTDGDGMSDAWEAANGTSAYIPDAISDPDSDGLVNVEEMRLGTNPLVADTDGDGASDYVEVRNTRGNPLVADIVWGTPIDASARVAGASFSASTGTWRTDAPGAAFAAERAGSLTWNLAVPAEGADALAVNIAQHNLYSKATTFDIALYVDGLFVTRQVVSAPYGSASDAFFFLPEIPAGEHEFRLVWHNWEVNTFLAVNDLRFVRFDGPDADNDGIADWKNHRADESSAIEDLPLESLVSPLCVEGRDLWRDVLEVEVAYPETNATFATVKTIGDGFYADVPLPENGTAVVSMHDRGLADSFPVVWKALDVFEGEYATNALAIREGDALKIAPFDGKSSEVAVSRANDNDEWIAVTNWTSSAATPYCFDEKGIYLVQVAHHGIISDDIAHALVEVVHSRFPKRNPAILMDARQKLACPDLSPRNLLEYDSDLQLAAEASEAGGVTLSMLTHIDRDLGLVSRLDEGGAISDAVQVTPVWADNGTYYRVAETYPDGSQLVQVSLLLGAVPEGTTVNLEIFVSGVTFDNGTRTKTLTASDFDADGHITLRFIKARGVTTSVCHSTKIFQDGKLIYTNR